MNTADIQIQVSVKHTRQLFNDRDPSPFKERELDENFVRYLLNTVQEKPLKTPTRLEIRITDEPTNIAEIENIREAIQYFFEYEASIFSSRKKKSMREGRVFMVVGLLILFGFLSLSQVLSSIFTDSKVMLIIQEGFVIIGWVAMWRPLEMFLYDWWPLREQELFMRKLARMEKTISFGSRPI